MASINRSGGYLSMEELAGLNNPAPETQPQNPVSPPGYTYRSGGWTHVNLVPVQQQETTRQSYRANAGRGNFDRMLSPPVQQQAESSATGAAYEAEENTVNAPLPAGVMRRVWSKTSHHKEGGVTYRAKSSDDRQQESFTVGRKYSESEARAAAIAARQSMEAGTWVPKSQR